jgi:AI-2 transport protein TqsA
MDMRENKLVHISIIFIAAVIFIMMLKELDSFMRPFAIAIILMFLLMPLLRWGERHRIPQWISLSVTLLGVLLFLVFVGLIVAGEGQNFAASISQEAVAEGITPLDKILGNLGFADKNLQEYIQPGQVASTISTIAGNVAQGGTQLFSELFLVFLFLIFLLPSYNHFIKAMGTDKKKGQRLKHALEEIEKSVKEYLVTKSIISILTGITTGVILFLFGADLVIVLALITFVLNFIPNIGSFVAVVIAGIVYALTIGVGWPLFWMMILLTATQQFYGSYLEPKMAGKKLKMSPLIILLSLFFWGWVWGIPGMLISVPLTAIIKRTMERIESTKHIARFME